MFIPAFIPSENYYSLVQSLGLCEEGSVHKTAMFIFGSPASSIAQTLSAVSCVPVALGFFEPMRVLHAGSHTTTSDFGNPAAGDGWCITRGFSEHLKLTLADSAASVSLQLTGPLCTVPGPVLVLQQYTGDHHRTSSSASSETVPFCIYLF